MLLSAALALLLAAGPEPERVHFDEAIRRALAQNANAQVAVGEVLRAEGLLGEARSGSLPTLVGQAIYTRLDSDRRLQSPGSVVPVTNGGSTVGTVTLPSTNAIIAAKNQESLNAVLTVPLIAPPQWTRWSHGADQLEVAQRTEKDVQRQVAILAGRAYLAVFAQRRVVEVTVRAYDTARAHYDFAHTRFAGGVGNRVDEVRAQQTVDADLAQVEVARGNLVRTQEALGVATGVDAPLDVAEEPQLAGAPEAARGLAEAEERRTDVKAAQARADAAERVVRDTWIDYLPSLFGVAQPFYQNPPTLTTPQIGWQAQLLFVWTFYDGGIRPAQHKEQNALATEAHALFDAAVRQAHSDVRLAYETLQRSDAALDAAKKSAASAKLVLDLATRAYQAGATGNLEVIDAERVALDAETSAVISEDAVRQARLDLLAATGHFP